MEIATYFSDGIERLYNYVSSYTVLVSDITCRWRTLGWLLFACSMTDRARGLMQWCCVLQCSGAVLCSAVVLRGVLRGCCEVVQCCDED